MRLLHSILRLFLLPLAIMLLGDELNAQTLEQARQYAGTYQWEKARTEIDSFITKPSNASNAAAWQLRSLIYYKLASDEKTRTIVPKGHRQAFEFYKQYLFLDTTRADTSRQGNEILFGLLYHNIDRANNDFQHKRYASALETLLDVETMETFITEKNLKYQDMSFPVFDTQLYVNIAAAAAGAGNTEVAVRYYKKVADLKIKSKGFDGIYRYLVDHSAKKADRAARNKYLAIGMELYPEDPYWCQVMVQDAGPEPKKMFARFDELVKDSCNNYQTCYNYAAALYNYSFKHTPKPADHLEFQNRIPVLLEKAIAFRGTAEASLLMCRYQLLLMNELIDEYNGIKGSTAAQQKKKEQLTAQISQRNEQVNVYAMNVYNLFDKKAALQPEEKEQFIIACKMLSEYWDRKHDKVRKKEFAEKARLAGL